MKTRLIACVVFFLMLLISAATAFAEGETAAPDRSPVNLSGRIYFQWYKTIENNDESENINGFELNRVYLTFDRALNSAFSVLVTLDAGNDNGASDTRYQNFVKFAYGQFVGDLGFARATLRTGLIPIAVPALIDSVSDYRWLANNISTGERPTVSDALQAGSASILPRTSA